MILHSIISEYDIFFNDQTIKTYEKNFGSGIITMAEQNGKFRPYSFFSTDPSDYLDIDRRMNEIK